MNKRKVLSILLLALITVALAVSCSSNIDTPVTNTEELAYVTFGNGHSRELGTSYLTEDYDNLYWFYTADKDDNYGTTGETLAEKPVSATYDNQGTINTISKGLGGKVGPFSQGKWIFTLKAYSALSGNAGSNLVYESGSVNVTLKGSEVKNVPVSVSLTGADGYVKFNGAYFKWNGSSGSSIPKMKISLIPSSGESIQNTVALNAKNNDNKLTITDETSLLKGESNKIPAGYYIANVIVYLEDILADGTVINNLDTPVFKQSFGLRVYGNAITYISGDMVEGVDSWVTFDVPEQTMKVFTVNSSNETPVRVAITAQNGNKESAETIQDNDWTIVSFPAGTLDSSSVHQLDVKVTPTASAEQKFQVSVTSAGQAAVAGLDLSLTKITKNNDGTTQQDPVTQFNNYVTVNTYIATGLDNVSVVYRKYENNTFTDTVIAQNLPEDNSEEASYNVTSGLLSFKTNHFSEYYVKANAEAMNTATGMVYPTFENAVSLALNGQEVKLLKDVCLTKSIVIEKDLALDLNGCDITVSATNFSGIISYTSQAPFYVKSGAKFTINDSSTGAERGKIDATANENVLAAVLLTIKDNNDETKTAELVVNDGELKGKYYAISTNGTRHNTSIVINGGSIIGSSDDGSLAIYNPNNGSVIINGGQLSGYDSAIEIRAGQLLINAGSFESRTRTFICDANGSGSTTSGAAIAIAQHTTKKDISVEINGGTFTGIRALNESNPQANNPAPQVSLAVKGGTFRGVVRADDTLGFITGGTFSSDPTAYVAEKYYAEQQISGMYEVKKATNWIQVADTSWYGDGTATEFSIGNAKELAGLAKLVNDKKKNFSGKTVNITADINLEGLNWTPIGMSGASFNGTFDGCNYTISNMSAINDLDFGNGFFGNTIGATIKNISFENAFVSRYSDPYYYYGNVYGIVAGYAYGQTTFDNVTVKNSTIRGFGKIGAILGMAADPGNHETIFNSCTVDNVNMYGVYDVGGLAGLVQNILVVDKEKIDNKNTTVENINWVQDITEKYELLNNARVVENEINQATGKTCYLNGKAINGSYWLYDVYLYGGFAKYAVMYGTIAHDCKLQSPYGSYYLANMERVIDNLSQLETLNNPWKQQ